jgi:hypothetical protein
MGGVETDDETPVLREDDRELFSTLFSEAHLLRTLRLLILAGKKNLEFPPTQGVTALD